MTERTPAIRFGDPLRREFLDALRRGTTVPWLLASEWTRTDAYLLVAVAVRSDGADLVLAAGELDGGPRRWTVRQPLETLNGGDLFDVWREEFEERGHDGSTADHLALGATADLVAAIAAALLEGARLRPERATVLREIATTLDTHLVLPDVVPPPERTPLDEDEDEDDEQDEDEDEDEEEDWDDDDDAAVPAPALPPPPPRRRRPWGKAVAVTLLLAAVTAATVGLAVTDDPSDDDAASTDPTAVTAPSAVAEYSLLFSQADGTPIRLDPCHTYDYLVQPGSIPPEDASREAGASFAALEEATGVAFRFAGFSDERFPHPVDPAAPPRYPILVSFEHPDTSVALREGGAEHGLADGRPLGGLTLSGPVGVTEGRSVLTGGVVVANEELPELQRRRVVLHELGHLAGLGHSAGPAEIMAPQLADAGAAAYGTGDRAGLAMLGSAGGCVLDDAERLAVFGNSLTG